MLADAEALLDGARSDQPLAEDVRRLAARRRVLRADTKRLRAEKQELAAQFKTVGREADAAQLAAAKERMSVVSRALGDAETQLKHVENQLLEIADEPEARLPPNAVDLPPHVQALRRNDHVDGAIRIEPADARNRADWDAFVAAERGASLYHDSRWHDIVVQTMRQRSLSMLARNEAGAVVGVLPLFRLTSALFGDYAVSMPYVNYGGALGACSRVEEALLGEAAEQAARLGLRHAEFRDMAPRQGWQCRSDKVSMIRRLPGSREALDAELGAKVRAQIRRAEREDTTIHFGNDAAALSAFYDVFARNMRDLGTPVYARELFEAVLSGWPEDATLLIVRLGGKAVGGAFLIRHRETLEVPWASTLREANSLGVNMLMYWRALSFAIERGCRYFDFGRSTADSGTYRFKSQWGAQPAPHYWHYWLPAAGELPRLNPNNARYHALIAVWRRLPLSLTRWLGPRIVRNLP